MRGPPRGAATGRERSSDPALLLGARRSPSGAAGLPYGAAAHSAGQWL